MTMQNTVGPEGGRENQFNKEIGSAEERIAKRTRALRVFQPYGDLADMELDLLKIRLKDLRREKSRKG